MNKLPQTPIYLVQPGNPLIAQWKQPFEAFARKDIHTFTIDVPPEAVDEMDVAMPQQLVIALQHYPHLIDKFLFSLELKFQQIAGSELYYQEDDWKSDDKYHRWFCKMGQFPLVLFFLHDREARFSILAGDILADKRVTVKKIDEQQESYIGIVGNDVQLVSKRLFNACWLFHLFCHASGFDPKPCIESILADFDLPVTYEQVRKQYEEDVLKGIELRVG
ncbi:MAG: hypothetical protein KGZ58_08625 [Ignavibacteriales bacterium]|nr:hypothetical protein [Ignavibacteriales bacterium]